MSVRFGLLYSIPLLMASSLLAAGELATENVTFDKPVQVPEAVLPPGAYKIHLEDRLADRAVVRITEPGGADHYYLTVPSKKLNSGIKGLIFLSAAPQSEVLYGWECSTCQRPLEFVYPKAEAIKLTAETGKPMLAYDPAYDKLPANLSPEDRKVITLWLLSPKTVTPDGKGEGLVAAKYSSPKLAASAESIPKKMPQTSSSAFSEIATGLLSLAFAASLYIGRKFPFAGTNHM